jgi:cellulose synthase/poly-beta-1,6-N-acetylglucosamine synthase-like glycosyltransferase
LQAKLNFYNPNQNFLTRLFTSEYSLWFDLILPGLQSQNAYIPLGGTSNHFRTQDLRSFQGWDPFNVTEDCDLGARIFDAGFQTAIIDSTTYEEANSEIGNWIRQRSRWVKGYLQTFFVHTRNPVQFIRKHKQNAGIFALVIGMRASFLIINPILWLMTLAYFALRATFGPAIEALYPAPVFYIAVTSLIIGNFLQAYYYMIACARRKQWRLIKYVYAIPFYWILGSMAAILAVYQLIVKPHYWEKTKHGLAANHIRFLQEAGL